MNTASYELKTHLPRERLAQMMDDETTIPAQQAVELGFADKIMFAENQSQTQAYSRRRAMNCAAHAFKMKLDAEKKSAVKRGKKVAALRRHLILDGGINYGVARAV